MHTGRIDWSQDYALGFLLTMQTLFKQYLVRDMEFVILDRMGLQDFYVAQCELVLQVPDEGVENIAIS